MGKRNLRKYLVIMGLVLMLTGCSASAPQYQGENVDSSVALEETKEMVTEDAATDSANLQNGSSDGIKLSTNVNLNRKIIKTGQLNIETKKFDQTVQDLVNQIEVLGGFMQNCNIQGSPNVEAYQNRSAELTVRIPNKQFDTFINNTDRYGNVIGKSMVGEDVTDQYMDTEIRLSALEIKAERLRELLKQAGKLQDLFTIEQELANVTYEIESLKGTLKKYDSLVDFSTISIYVQETIEYQTPEKKPVTFTEKISSVFKESLRGVMIFLQSLILVIVAILPVILIIGVPLGIIAFIVIRLVVKKKKQPKKDDINE